MDVELYGSGSHEISSITYDSRKITKDSLFVAITGLRTDGRRFAFDALKNGAAAVASESLEGLPKDALLIQVPDARRFLAEVSARITGYPDREMLILAVTGTNGKTTLTYLLERIFSAAGQKTAVIGTTGFFNGERWQKLTHTTPESADLWETLAGFKSNGVKTVTMEISSHAIALERTWGLDVDRAIFTNLTQDHLDFHANMQDYKETKFRLFNEMKKEATAIINIDDPVGKEFVARIKDHPVTTYSIRTREADLWVEIEEMSMAGSATIVHYQGLALPVFLRLPGSHNIGNMAGAAAAALLSGIDPGYVRKGVEALTFVPGRMEPVPNNKDFFIFVDYAHTPDALDHLIRAARFLAKARVITLFGCGGDRDRDKRAKMGRIAAQLSDFIFVTSDNPRTEDPKAIIEGILAGVETSAKKVIVDRREAIFEAVRFLEPSDVLLIAGKGHEDYQILGAEKIHFDDREVAKEALDALP